MFELALEEDKIDSLTEEVSAVNAAIAENREFVKLLTHPQISEDEKLTMLENTFKGRVSETLVGFLVLLCQKNRFSEIDGIFEYFLDKVRAYKNIGVANVTSAMALTDAQKQQIEERLLQVTNFEKMETVYKVDSALIGGMVIRIGDRVVDGSIRSQLDRMEKQLSNIQLK